MRLYHVFYNKISSEIRVIYDGLDNPTDDDFVNVGTIEHDNANQSAQQLRTKAITLMAQEYPTHDIGMHSHVNFVNEEPYGKERTANSERKLEESVALDPEEVDANVGTAGSSVGDKVTENTADESVAGEGGEGQTIESIAEAQKEQVPEAEQVGGTSAEPKEEPVVPEGEKTVTVSAPETNLKVGETYMLEVKVNDKDARDMDLVYESSDTSVAKVTKAGKVTAVAKGEATIRTGLKEDMDKYADTKVIVEENA